jgi:hypothetical protein
MKEKKIKKEYSKKRKGKENKQRMGQNWVVCHPC